MRHHRAALVKSLAAVVPVLVAGGSVACTITSTEAPAISGPSELGVAITLRAAPEVLSQDGISQAVVVLVARDAYTRPVVALAVRADMRVDGVLQDFGRLSVRTLTTDNYGRASLIYTAPAPVFGTSAHTTVTLALTPLTGDARSQVPRTVDILLVPSPPP